MRHPLLTLCLVALSAMPMHAYKQQSLDINVNGQQRNMIVFTPNSLPAASPLFIVTHGMNQNPEYQYGSDKMYEMIDTAKFVIAYLRSDGNTWDIGGVKDQNFVIKTIDEMAARYGIDTNRVYWSGFSMGSMLIHHCIANMQDKIAAFAPTSGIQFSEQPWNNCKKPVNLLEVIAYGDDVFGYEQYGIHAYIENYAKHDKHTKYTKISNYKPVSTSWFDGDYERWTGGPDGGEVALYSYNNGGHWPMDLNRHLIWNFCKRFSLNSTTPIARLTAPANGTTQLSFAPKGEAEFADITLRATAKDPNGRIVQVDFYDGSTLIASKTRTPFTATLKNPTAGKHHLRVIATDNDGETSSDDCFVTLTAVPRQYIFSQQFTTGTVPEGWITYDGSTRRTGGELSYSDGARVLQFTGATRAFERGLYFYNGTGKRHEGCIRYGLATGNSTLTLQAGNYTLKYKLCNWDVTEAQPIELCIEKRTGQQVASTSVTPTTNLEGSTTKSHTGIRQASFDFDIAETGDYLISLYTADAKGADCVLGQLILMANSYEPTGINQPHASTQTNTPVQGTYDLSGRRLSGSTPHHGIYVKDGRKVAITANKHVR